MLRFIYYLVYVGLLSSCLLGTDTHNPIAIFTMAESQPRCTTVIALSNVRVFDGNVIQEPSTVIIDGEFIGTPETVPTHTIDAQGSVLLPGLIDSHIHLASPEDLKQMAKYGVTTALDMGTWPVELLSSMRGRKGVTDIRSAGLPATAEGSPHSHIPSLPRDALVDGPADAERFVAARMADEVDYIKVVPDVPGPDQETLNALVNAAHRSGKLVVAHAISTIATCMAQTAGVDVITHAPVDGVMTDQEVAQMLNEKRISIPTLIMMKNGTSLQEGADYDNSRKTVSALHRAGVPILAGSDGNEAEGVPANIKLGIGLHEELELLVESGLSATEALRAATCQPAKYFGLHDRGRIEPGRRADLVLVAGNPVEDIKSITRIEKVWIAGQEII